MPDVRQIPLTHGKVALVDTDDLVLVGQRNWRASLLNGRWYVVSGHQIMLHRFLLDPPPGIPVAFVDGDALNCRRANLRLRRGSPAVPASGAALAGQCRYVGVRRLADGRFSAYASYRGQTHYLGQFATERDAALAYNVGYRLLRGYDVRRSGGPGPNHVPPAVPLDELEAAIASLATRLGTARHSYRDDDKKATGGTA